MLLKSLSVAFKISSHALSYCPPDFRFAPSLTFLSKLFNASVTFCAACRTPDSKSSSPVASYVKKEDLLRENLLISEC